MLIRKGFGAWFKMVDGGARISAPRGSSMLHDPKGTSWGKCSLLFVRMRMNTRQPTEREIEGEAKHYLGKAHRYGVGSVELPPRALAGWEKLGAVDEIFYDRPGTKAPGLYKHPFGKRTALMLFRQGKKPLLYRRGSAMRLELGGSCLLDDRGVVFP
jgi:hypothetical protein